MCNEDVPNVVDLIRKLQLKNSTYVNKTYGDERKLFQEIAGAYQHRPRLLILA